MSEARKSHLKEILIGLFVTVVGGIVVVQYQEGLHKNKDEKEAPHPEEEILTSPKKSSSTNPDNIQPSYQSSNTSAKSYTPNYPESKIVESKEEDFSSYVNASSNKSTVSVIVVDANGNLLTDASSAIASIYKKSGKTTSTGLIRSGFIKKHEFQELKEGNSDIIEKLRLKAYTDYLAIGKITYSIRKGTLANETIVCTASISMSIISINSKSIEQSFTISNASGNGVTESQAQENAFQKLLDKYFIERSSL